MPATNNHIISISIDSPGGIDGKVSLWRRRWPERFMNRGCAAPQNRETVSEKDDTAAVME